MSGLVFCNGSVGVGVPGGAGAGVGEVVPLAVVCCVSQVPFAKAALWFESKMGFLSEVFA